MLWKYTEAFPLNSKRSHLITATKNSCSICMEPYPWTTRDPHTIFLCACGSFMNIQTLPQWDSWCLLKKCNSRLAIISVRAIKSLITKKKRIGISFLCLFLKQFLAILKKFLVSHWHFVWRQYNLRNWKYLSFRNQFLKYFRDFFPLRECSTSKLHLLSTSRFLIMWTIREE